MSVPKDLRYTKEHEWARQEGGDVVVGITDYAQSSLGDVVFVELPAVGTTVSKGQSFATVESVKAVSDIYAPVDGKIVAINESLSGAPETINSSPYDSAWMVKIQSPDGTKLGAQLNELLDAASYQSFIAELTK